MKTKPLYLENSYLKSMNAVVLEVSPEAPSKWKVLLSETVFYPMGGGQPTDQGYLYAKDWEGRVYQVLTVGGEIVHFVEAKEAPKVGLEVEGKIDWERRYRNMRLHSAGHVIDFAMFLLGYSPGQLTPIKADHGKKPTIWYQGAVEEDFRIALEEKANALVAEDLSFSTAFASLDELKGTAIYLQPNLPINKPLRMLSLENVGSVADGGTQVHQTKEVGQIKILPIEIKEGYTLIRYELGT